ncbi:unnamed protein product, partial [Prorocentrum cordatum]
LGPTDSRAIMNWRKRRLLDVRRTSVHGGPAEGAGAGGETFWEERTQGSLPRLKDDVPEPMETKPRRAQAMLPWDGIEDDRLGAGPPASSAEGAGASGRGVGRARAARGVRRAGGW